ncbi:DUF4349 domain-containing protein [Streptomyces sp. RKND-216]|uniref:DUF4349 domain-containing protein n=1 Tax=Streptomyces sp. RKND-216 TaxID=2562581 RepID=UPI00109DED68|nr:DUF4349 domain-containing protein [Streptomyces sp. RKND-216]THA23905.1 DUF4349 domain-containing protein [Streptomyces sp. RKND-216]
MQGKYGSADAGGRPARVRAALGAALLAGALAVAGCGASGASSDGASGVSADSKSDAGGLTRSEENAQSEPGGSRAEAGSSPGSSPGSGTAADGSTDGSTDGDTAADTARAAERHVIKTASLTVETEDVQDGLDEARRAVGTAGGYVSEETTDRDADGDERSRITFKVPPEEYDGLLDALAGIGELEDRKQSAQDVTGEVVDVESRIKTQKASVDRVRKLMEDATELSDVVSLESELSTRQADLEALQARLESLEARSGMATVTMELRTPDAAPVEEEDEDPSVGGAFSGGWDAFVTMLRWIAVAIGASLPFLVALGLLYVLWRTLHGRLPRRTPVAATTAAAVPARPATPPGVPSQTAEPKETAEPKKTEG